MKPIKLPVLMLALLLSQLCANAFYNPSSGRWLSRDPIDERGGRNLFAFVENDGIAHLDKLGLRKCKWTIIMGHMIEDGIPALDEALGSNPPQGCTPSKWGFMTCGSDFLTSQLDEANQLPLPPELWGMDSEDSISEEHLEAANQAMDNLPNTAQLPDITNQNAHYGDAGASDAILTYYYVMKLGNAACKDKTSCCSSISISFRCNQKLSDSIDRNINGFKGTGHKPFDGASNPCGKNHSIKCR